MAQVSDDLVTRVRADGVDNYVRGFNRMEKSLKTAGQRLAEFESRTARIRQASASIGRAGIQMAAAGAGITAFLGLAVREASRVEEQMNLFREVFKDNADEVQAWAEGFAEATGRTKYELMSFAGQFQALLVPMGLTRKEAAGMSEQLGELVVDIASFRNLTQEDVAAKLVSGLAGMHRALYDLGIVIGQESIKQELLNMGIKRSWEEVTAAEKVQARYNIILQRTADAQGDATRTAGSLENRTRRLTSEYQEMMVALGQGLYPAAQKVIGTAIDLLDRFNDLDDRTKKLVAILAGAGGLGLAIGGVSLKLVDLGIRTYLSITATKLYQRALAKEVEWAGAAAKANWGLAGARTAAGVSGGVAAAGGAAAGAGAAAGVGGTLGGMAAGGAIGGALTGIAAGTAGVALGLGIAAVIGYPIYAAMKKSIEEAAQEGIAPGASALGTLVGGMGGVVGGDASSIDSTTRQYGSLLDIVNTLYTLEKLATEEVERRNKLLREQMGLIDAQVGMAQAMVENLEARGARGGRLRRAQQWLAGVQFQAAAQKQQAVYSPQAKFLSPQERIQLQTEAIRMATSGVQTWMGGRKLHINHSPWRAMTADRNMEAAYSAAGSAQPTY